jgi:prepilin-type processing-associated H-X9-DG protein
MSPSLLTFNSQVDVTNPLETQAYNYALAYQSPGTCRAACPIKTPKTSSLMGVGGRQPLIPDPTSSLAAKPYDNSQYGNPSGWFTKHKSGAAPDDPSEDLAGETSCYIQAVMPAEVQCPGRVYFLADGRDYRPYCETYQPGGGYPPAGKYNGFYMAAGNRIVVGSRHYGYANVMYLDGRVTRDGQTHDSTWNMDYEPATQQARSTQWRVATFDWRIYLASINGQGPMMPVLMVRGWEAFFDANGMRAR